MKTSVPANYILLFLLAINLSLVACHEVFEPEIAKVESYPVVEGFISTKPGPHSIRLQYSQSIGETSFGNGILGASVYVNSLENENIQFKDMGGGIYQADLDSNSVAKIGHTYTLSVYSSEGDVYLSKPQKVKECPDIKGIGCIAKKEYTLTEDAYGKALEKELEGMEVRIKTLVTPEESSYFLYEYIGYEQHQVNYKVPFAALESFMFSHRLLSHRYLNEIHTINANDYGIDKNINDRLLFIAEQDMLNFNHGLDSTVKIYLNRFEGLIMKIQQLSISRDAYEVYTDIENMLAAEGTLFDPPVPKLASNIFCTNDSTKKVMGVFSAVDIDTYYTYLYIRNGRTYEAELDSMPPLYVESPAARKPATWIDIPF